MDTTTTPTVPDAAFWTSSDPLASAAETWTFETAVPPARETSAVPSVPNSADPLTVVAGGVVVGGAVVVVAPD